ncbi:MAG TPA: 2-dehydropantoate 2-reductase [Rhizomicrobium sp.]|jgi:2-dehydropantoate 2-reductase
MRIGIVGAGAIGGLIGIPLARRGHAVQVLARGETFSALRKGWILQWAGERLTADVRASDDAAELGIQDVLVLAVKGPALSEAVRAAKPMFGPATLVVPAMNGVPWWFLLPGGGALPPTALRSADPGGTIARAIPFRSIVGCVVHASAQVSAPGVVVHQGGNRLIFGEPDGELSQRLNAIADLFEGTGFDIVQSDRIQRDIWYKLWGNMTMNPISALCGATCDRIIEDELVRGFVLRVMAEAAEIGNRIGCEIHESGEARLEIARRLGAFRTSMLQDAEAGRPLEIDQLLAAPQEIARLVSVPTPSLDTLLGLIRLFAGTRGLYRS